MKPNTHIKKKHRRNQNFALDKNVEKETFEESKHKKKVDENEAKKPDEERALLDKLPGETTQPHIESSRK